jgi:hypothetical protein
MARRVAEIDEELQTLDLKLKQLKRDYDQYFLGSKPREPAQLRGEVKKLILHFTNSQIKNTAARFRFTSINSRYQTFKRQWDVTLRQIEQGTYARHVFKADLKEREAKLQTGQPASSTRAKADEGSEERLFESYVTAAKSCGRDVSQITPEKLQRVIAKQEAALKAKLGCAQVKFRVVVQDGRVKLKASGVG